MKPEDPAAVLLSRARKAMAGGRLKEALEYLHKARKLAPDNVHVLTMMANCLCISGRFDKAERHFRRIVELQPQKHSSHSLLGRYLASRRRYLDSIPCFQRARELAPKNAVIRYYLGQSLHRAGQPDVARPELQRALAIREDMPLTHYELGLIHLEAEDWEAAGQCLARARELDPDSAFIRAACASLEAESTAAQRLAGQTRTRRIVLHMNKEFHFSHLLPLFNILKERHQVRITADPEQLSAFQPDTVIVAEATGSGLRRLLPDAVYIYVRHGLIAKNHAWKAAAQCDYLAGVSSDHVRDLAVQNGGLDPEHIWVTGYVQMDPLFRGATPDLPVDLPAGRRTVLFAPTYNEKLSSLSLMRQRCAELIRGGRTDLNILIKPHPQTCRERPELMAMLRRLAADNDDVYLLSDAASDAMACLKSADLLVSDACSMALAYLALDRPLVLITHPQHRQDHGYDPEGLEWRWRDMGEEVLDIEELPAAVDRALDKPALHAERRAEYRQLLFGELQDGRAAERIAARINALPQ